MKVCGIELKSNEARIIVLEGHSEDFEIIKVDLEKLKLTDSKDQQAVKAFRDTIIDFLSYHDFDMIGIKERITKGRFAGGALSFKMEGLLQTADDKVVLVHNMSMKSTLKDVELPIDGIKKYQEEALRVALYLLHKADDL